MVSAKRDGLVAAMERRPHKHDLHATGHVHTANALMPDGEPDASGVARRVPRAIEGRTVADLRPGTETALARTGADVDTVLPTLAHEMETA